MKHMGLPSKRLKLSRSAKTKQLYLERLKEERGCIDCGEKDPDCLDFDHVRGVKKNGILNVGWTTEASVFHEELAKCEVRCANCHRKRHARERRLKRLG
jgi:hypothetical protein